MNFNIWFKRLLIIILLITSLLLAVFIGSRNKTHQAMSEVKSEKTIFSPSHIKFMSKSQGQDKAITKNKSSYTNTDSKLAIKSLDRKSKQNKLNFNSITTNKTDENQTSNIHKLSQKKNKYNEKNTSKNPNQNQLQQFPKLAYKTTQDFQRYKPKYIIALADPSNYGDRYSVDVNGLPLQNRPIVVIHETSNSASSAINTFKNNHTDDSQQVSYHALITLDGTVVYLVPPEKRAYGAGNSVFESNRGIETVKTNPNLPPSVNNFAYHVSLETPVEAHGKYGYKTHSGYTDLQYRSLAWLLAQSDIPDQRITTHRAVDRSGQRIDPRSFDFNKFFNLLHKYRQPIASTSKQTEVIGHLPKIYDPA